LADEIFERCAAVRLAADKLQQIVCFHVSLYRSALPRLTGRASPVAGIHALTGSVAILMTVVVIVAMQQRKPRALDTSMAAPSPGDGSRAGYEEALLLMVIYLITSVVVFRVG
jgi:hypothetical protein